MIYFNRLLWNDPIRDAWTLYSLAQDLNTEQTKKLFVQIMSLEHDPDSPGFSARYPKNWPWIIRALEPMEPYWYPEKKISMMPQQLSRSEIESSFYLFNLLRSVASAVFFHCCPWHYMQERETFEKFDLIASMPFLEREMKDTFPQVFLNFQEPDHSHDLSL